MPIRLLLNFDKQNRVYTDKDWRFFEVKNTISSLYYMRQVKAIMYFLFALRLILLIEYSLIVKFYLKCFSRILKEIFLFTTFFLVLAISFTLIIHAFTGQKNSDSTDFFNCLYTAIKFLLFYGDSSILKDNSIIEKYIILILNFFILNLIFSFSYAFFKDIYYEEYKIFRIYKSQITYSCFGDYLEFITTFFIENIVFLLKTYWRFKSFKQKIDEIIDNDFNEEKFNQYQSKKIFYFIL